MSEMATEHPWIANLETKGAEVDLMRWDISVPIYCVIERIIMAKKNAIPSAKLEWLTQRNFGVSRVEESCLFLRKGTNFYDPALILNHPPPECGPRVAIEKKPVRAKVAEQERKPPITNNESSFEVYMTQELINPSLVPETALANFDTEDENTRIGDSGASSHLTNDNRWMYSTQPIQGSVIVANCHKISLENTLLSHLSRTYNIIKK